MNLPKKPRTWLSLGLIVSAVLILSALFVRHNDAPATTAQYTTSPVIRGELLKTVTTTGQLAPSTSVEVSSQISGLVIEVNVDFNSPVKKGQVLARIDPATFEQRVEQAEANLQAAQANHALAVLNARRMEELRRQDLVTQQEFDIVKAQLEQSKANLLTQRAALKNARVDLERCTIVSPIDGIVIYKQIEVGKTVVSSLSAPTLFTIARDLTKMQIVAPVNEVDIWSIKPGQPVTFELDALPGRKFNGKLVQIRNPYTPSDKQQQPAQGSVPTFDVVIEVDNSDHFLRPSVTANVAIVVDKRSDALLIPNGALRVRLASVPGPSDLPASKEMNATVYVLERGEGTESPRAVPVQLGITDSMMTEVLAGLSEGDMVITGTPPVVEVPRRRGLFF